MNDECRCDDLERRLDDLEYDFRQLNTDEDYQELRRQISQLEDELNEAMIRIEELENKINEN